MTDCSFSCVQGQNDSVECLGCECISHCCRPENTIVLVGSVIEVNMSDNHFTSTALSIRTRIPRTDKNVFYQNW